MLISSVCLRRGLCVEVVLSLNTVILWPLFKHVTPCLYHSRMFFGSRYLGIRIQPLLKDLKITDCLMFFPVAKPPFPIAFYGVWTAGMFVNLSCETLKLLRGRRRRSISRNVSSTGPCFSLIIWYLICNVKSCGFLV